MADYFKYYIGTANGLITVMLILGFLEGIITGRWVFFEVALVGMLLNEARREEPIVLVTQQQEEQDGDK